MCLTPEQWALIQPLLPPAAPALRGRPPLDERRILEAVLWKIRTASPWYDLPPGFPSWQTCYRRYHFWERQGILNAVISALDRDLRDRGGFNLRAVLAVQRIRFVPLGEQTHIVFDASLQNMLRDTWQLETIYLLLAVLFRVIRKKYPARYLRLASPDLRVPPPAPFSQPDC
jgi:transposase